MPPLTTHPFDIAILCPLCKGTVEYANDNVITCLSCDAEFPQPRDKFINLMPLQAMHDRDNQWQVRQLEMEMWYKDLLTDTKTAASLFEHDYRPYKSYLNSLSGNILDLGGGVGIVRHYLSDKSNYIVVDPSVDWLDSDWQSLAHSYPCLNSKPNFIMGVGEHLMFESNTFNAVLSFWSMNHVSNPAQVFNEVNRVLQPGGRFFIVLEDMQPWWTDFLSSKMRSYFGKEDLKELLKQKINASFFGKKWPVQDDHIFITDKDIRDWSKNLFSRMKREWRGAYLTYEFIK